MPFGKFTAITAAIMLAVALSYSDDLPIPPLDPGEIIGAPRRAEPATPRPAPAQSGNEAIPVAEPVEEHIPVARPVTDATPQVSLIPALPRVPKEPVDNHLTQVAVLGYHDFSDINPPTEMRMRTSIFRQQMEAIKTAGIPVISMEDFILWRKGNIKLPPYCILITIDDGWKSVYTDAFPILKEMRLPFTLFPYTNFLTGRGSSLSISQVQEMQRSGASVGSHSTRHLYPSEWKKSQRRGPGDYRKTIETEIRNSKFWLENNFQKSVQAYCYPGGYHTPEMIEALQEFGYEAAFTVIGRMATMDSPQYEIPRFMVYGNNLQTFTRAMRFRPIESASSQGQPAGNGFSLVPAPAQKVEPAANTTTGNLLPVISIELDNAHDILTDSLEMQVSGFGKVPAALIDGQPVYQWKANRPVRTASVTVRVNWKTVSGRKESAEWQFGVSAKEPGRLPANVIK